MSVDIFSEQLKTKALSILSDVAKTNEVITNLNLQIYDLQILDSLKTVELIVSFQEAFGIQIPPMDFEYDLWRTPKHILIDLEKRFIKKTHC